MKVDLRRTHHLEHPGPSTTGCTKRRYTRPSQNIAKGRYGEESVVVVTGLSGESRLSKTGLITYMRSALMDNIWYASQIEKCE